MVTTERGGQTGKALRTRNREAVEIALDDENGDIVAEVIAAKICRSVVDAAHELFGGERRTNADHCGKALHTEFFTKRVLRLSDPIGIENQNIAGHEVFRCEL